MPWALVNICNNTINQFETVFFFFFKSKRMIAPSVLFLIGYYERNFFMLYLTNNEMNKQSTHTFAWRQIVNRKIKLFARIDSFVVYSMSWNQWLTHVFQIENVVACALSRSRLRPSVPFATDQITTWTVFIEHEELNEFMSIECHKPILIAKHEFFFLSCSVATTASLCRCLNCVVYTNISYAIHKAGKRYWFAWANSEATKQFNNETEKKNNTHYNFDVDCFFLFARERIRKFGKRRLYRAFVVVGYKAVADINTRWVQSVWLKMRFFAPTKMTSCVYISNSSTPISIADKL